MVAERIQEVIFVGLPGPTHNYGGLSVDNVASSRHAGQASHPKDAARQALQLAELLLSLGVQVAILPPQLRPHEALLRQHFDGDLPTMVARAARENPQLLERATSSSAMWTANAATITPSLDAVDGRLHLTVANLHTHLHRRIEAEDTYRTLKAIFEHVPAAAVHAPLDASLGLRDEGAANHMRLAPKGKGNGLHIFVYGAQGSPTDPATARQSLKASQAIGEDHQIAEQAIMFLKQNPAVIEKGVFHNDVIAVSNDAFLLAHADAYEGGEKIFSHIADAYHGLHGKNPLMRIVQREELSVEEAVATYFFNSQIVSFDDGAMAIIAPLEVRELFGGKAARLMEKICESSDTPIEEINYIDLRQSMRNGGGPACLRLRVPMTDAQIAGLRGSVNVLADDGLLEEIGRIVETCYPDQLTSQDIAQPSLYEHSRNVLAKLSDVMKIPLL